MPTTLLLRSLLLGLFNPGVLRASLQCLQELLRTDPRLETSVAPAWRGMIRDLFFFLQLRFARAAGAPTAISSATSQTVSQSRAVLAMAPACRRVHVGSCVVAFPVSEGLRFSEFEAPQASTRRKKAETG